MTTQEQVDQQIFSNAFIQTQKDGAYKIYNNKATELAQKIVDCLGPDSELFFEFESLINQAEVIYLRNIYTLGIANGLKQLN